MDKELKLPLPNSKVVVFIRFPSAQSVIAQLRSQLSQLRTVKV